MEETGETKRDRRDGETEETKETVKRRDGRNFPKVKCSRKMTFGIVDS